MARSTDGLRLCRERGYQEVPRIRAAASVHGLGRRDMPDVRAFVAQMRLSSFELNGNTGEVLSWACAKLAEGSTPLTPDEALHVAEAAAQPPPGAVLIQQGYEDMAGTPVFVAHWEHREDGVPVERDYLRVLVSGHSGQVFSIQRWWHAIDPDFSER